MANDFTSESSPLSKIEKLIEENECVEDDTYSLHPIDKLKESLSVSGDFKAIKSENKDKFEAFIKSFIQAEVDIKSAEISDPIKNGILIPAINELRYCSYHITKAFYATSVSEQYEELSRAERHCFRASFDALELGLTTILEDIDSITRKYSGKVKLSDIIGNWSEKMADAHEAQDLLGANYKDKQEHFHKVANSLNKLKKFSRELHVSEDQFHTHIRQNRKPLYITALSAFFAGIIATTAVVKLLNTEEPAALVEKLPGKKVGLSDEKIIDKKKASIDTNS
ncbi:hypothetical protein [Thalassotalea ganghwensis]